MKYVGSLLLLLAAIAAQGQTITEYRWWVNDDLATLTTSAAGPDDDLALAATLDLPALTREFNLLTVQFKDSDGHYSVPYTTWYTKRTGPVTGYAYWIDDQIADSYTGSIGPNTLVDLIADLPTGVPAGPHTFTIRFSGANGAWSVPLTVAFNSFVGIEELPGVSEVLLFPNPVTDQLGLRLNSDAARTLSMHVLDLSGALVKDLSAWSVSGTTHRNWDVNALASGSYVLRISDGHGTRNLPFVKP